MENLELTRSPDRKYTRIVVSNAEATVTIEVRSNLPPRDRRTIGITFLRLLSPFLRYFSTAEVFYSEDRSLDTWRTLARGVRIFRSASPDSETGRMGFEIRMARLKYAWSQTDLAAKANLSQFHISRLERGLCHPNASTIAILERVLNQRLPSLGLRKKGENVLIGQGKKIFSEMARELSRS